MIICAKELYKEYQKYEIFIEHCKSKLEKKICIIFIHSLHHMYEVNIKI